MRQVADRRQHPVMGVGVHVDHIRFASLPGAAHQVQRGRRILAQRRQDDRALAVKAGIGGFGSGALGARDGMAWHELRDPVAQGGPRRGNHFKLGAARIGQHGTGAQMRTHACQRVRQPAHRRRQQPLVGARGRFLGARGLVDQAQLNGARQGLRIAPYPQHPADLPGAAQGCGEGSADQTHPHDGQYRNQGASGPLIGFR